MQPEYSEKFFEYCLGMAQEFNARINRIRVFAKHNLTSGNANEVILRDFLSMHAPKDFHVGQGFICDPTTINKVSRQCDILVYNQATFPVVYEDGPIKIVWPDSARMVIEIKTSLNKKSIEQAIENIKDARMVSNSSTGVIFSFHPRLRIETLKKHLLVNLNKVSDNHKPAAIILFDQGIIIQRTSKPSVYTIRQAVDEKQGQAVTIAYLLLLFFENVWHWGGTDYASVYEIKRSILGTYTKSIGNLECAPLK